MSPISLFGSCLTFVLLFITAGCHTAWWPGATGGFEGLPDAKQALTAPTSMRSSEQPRLVAKPESQPPVQQASATTLLEDPPAMPADQDAVLRELQALGQVDPAAAQQLVLQLQEVKPSLRALAAQQYRAAWEYHRQLQAEEQRPPTESSPPHVPLGKPLDQQTLDRQPLDQQPADATATPARLLEGGTEASIPGYPIPGSHASLLPTASTMAGKNARPATATGIATENRKEGFSAVASPSRQDHSIQQVSHTSPLRMLPTVEEQTAHEPLPSAELLPKTWQGHVALAIEKLAAGAPADPHRTAEAYSHVQLRLLQLVAGDREAALEPIPGLTPTEQGYWSNQLFALSTLLNRTEQPDDEQRAALAGTQLLDAIGRLGELSALTLRNAAFCGEVYGFGDYEPVDKPATFKPGEAVRLYVEVDNFRSESTDKGYHTSLATSYEVLDQHGKRIQGGEFGTVNDYCMRRRRDFYIEYTLDLPSRIYASGYQLRLMLRDRLSGKIGTATIDFEIAE